VVVPGLKSSRPGRRASRWLGVVLAAAIASFLLAACGGGDDNSDTTAASNNATGTSGTGAAGGGESVNIGESEFKLDPSDVNVKAGTVTFDVTNDGTITHDLEVEGEDQGVEEKTDVISPGESATLTVDLSKPGKYEMYCTIDSHRQEGMEGDITVQ